MKLIIYEIKKVISQRVFILVLLLSLLVNGVILYNNQVAKPNNYMLTHSSNYADIISKYSSYANDEAVKLIEDKMIAYEILSKFKELSSSSDAEYVRNLTNELNDYKKEQPSAYAEAERLGESHEDEMSSKYFLEDIHAQLKYLNSYPAFLEQMSNRAKSQSKASIFNDAESFSYRNLFKTTNDYKNLKNLSMKIGKNSTLIETSKYNIGNYFILAILFLICIYLFNNEREKGLYNLVRSTENGRFSTIIAKLCAFSVLAIIVSLMFTASEFSVNSMLYGIDTLDRNIQSIPGFRNCVLNISVLKYCFIYLLSKTLNFLVIGMFFALVFVCFSSQFKMYLCCACVLAVEYVFYFFIPAEASLSQLKYINIFYFISSDFLAKYINVDIVGYPINITIIAFIMGIFILLICIVVSSLAFSKNKQSKSMGRFNNLIEKLKTKFFKISGSTNLLACELYKYLFQSKFVIFFLVLVLFGVFNSFGTIPYNYSNQSDVIYKEHMRHLNGQITQEKIRYISDQEKHLEKLEEKLYSSDEYGKMADVISNFLENEREALSRVKSQKDRIQKQNKQGVNTEFIDENIYSEFIYDTEREWGSFALLCLLIIISIPIVFTREYKGSVINLLRPTQKGKLPLYVNKILIIFISALVVYLCVNLPYFIKFICSHGVNDLTKPICAIEQFSNSKITVLTAFVIKNIACFSLALWVSSIVALVSILMKNNLLSLVFSTIFLLIPILLLKDNAFIRVGYMFTVNWIFVFTLLITIGLMLIIFLLTAGGMLFTSTRLGKGYKDET